MAQPPTPSSTTRQRALGGVTVVDTTQGVAGPYCSMLLAGLGADVIKLEPPAGDYVRQWPPYVDDAPGVERSIYFLHLNRAKRSVVLDPTSEADREQLAAIASTADVVMIDDGGGGGPRWDLDLEALRADRPDLVVADLPLISSGAEPAGWRWNELIVAALSGLAACTGEADREPLKPGGQIASVAQGQTAATAIATALLAIRRGGAGSSIEIPAVESAADLLEMWACGAYQERPMPRMGREHNSNFPFEVHPALDGYVGVHAAPGPWSAVTELIGRPDLDRPELNNPAVRIEQRELVVSALEAWLAETGRIEAYHAAQAKRLAFGYVATAEDLLNSPQLNARDFFQAIDHPVAGSARYAGAPFRLSSGWVHGRAPLLGEHSSEVAEALGDLRSDHTPAPASESRPDADPLAPLAGIRVLDLTQIWAGPRATKVLSDYGADVIKIEAPTRFDSTRAYPRFLADLESGRIDNESEHNHRAQFDQLHRAQRSITLDLRSASGATAFRELVAVSDVVIANFAAGVLDRLEISWPHLEAVNPRLVLISMPSFGDTGPERDYVAYGVTQEELAGLYGMTGYEDDGPLKTGSNVGDPMNGMHGAFAVASALVERERTGFGQYIEMSQLESSVQFIGETLVDYAVNGRINGPQGNTHPRWAPQGVYPATGDDQWIAITAEDDAQWQTIVEVLGVEALRDDPRFADEPARHEARMALDQELAAATASHDRFELARELQRRGVPAAPVLNSMEVQRHRWLTEPGYVQTLPHPSGEYRYFGPIWRINGERPALRGPAPLLGEHQTEVLTALTSLSNDEAAAQLPELPAPAGD
jgi:crotonobetainyl-CoA:carnitine CoA-transferase CaiB-like acyl-CoA transferase